MNIQELYKIFLSQSGITTDTRSIKPGQVFFALKGDNFNGNKYAVNALQTGASFAVVDETINTLNDYYEKQLIIVDNVLQTLQDLAKYHRQQFKIPFIAITGSNGKTTTKELVAKVLSSRYKTHATEGNLNNHIGIPLTILKVPLDAQMAIIEMGANHQHEIESYCTYTLPDFGLITNCGKAHLEGFGGVEGVIKGKGELFKFLEKNNGLAFVNNYDQAIIKLSENIIKKYSYGPSGIVEGAAETHASFLRVNISNPQLFTIDTKLVGDYNLPNVLAAVAIGLYFQLSQEEITRSIESYEPSNSRSQLLHHGTNQIILDAYNANPSSMKAAIQNFVSMDGTKKVLLLGSMMELGDDSANEHQTIINLIRENNWEAVILVGEQFNSLSHNYISFNTSQEAGEWFRSKNFQDTKILIKGSRSMKMEKVLD